VLIKRNLAVFTCGNCQ